MDVQWWLALGGGVIAIVTAIARTAFWAGRTYLQPIIQSMEALTQSMNELKETLKAQIEKMHELELHIQRVEDKCLSNQHRIEHLERERR